MATSLSVNARVAGQHHRRERFAERVRPAVRRARVRAYRVVRDRLGGDEMMRHHAAEQIVFADDAESLGLVVQQRMLRDEIRVRPIGVTILTGERKAEQFGQPLRDGAARQIFVAPFVFRVRAEGDELLGEGHIASMMLPSLTTARQFGCHGSRGCFPRAIKAIRRWGGP